MFPKGANGSLPQGTLAQASNGTLVCLLTSGSMLYHDTGEFYLCLNLKLAPAPLCCGCGSASILAAGDLAGSGPIFGCPHLPGSFLRDPWSNHRARTPNLPPRHASCDHQLQSCLLEVVVGVAVVVAAEVAEEADSESMWPCAR